VRPATSDGPTASWTVICCGPGASACTAETTSQLVPAGFAFREQPYTVTYTNPGDARIEFVEFSLK
jgi:hypothetical protein